MSEPWPETLPAVQVRSARPTEKLDEVVAFYTDALGLPELGRSEGDGWTVVFVGLPGRETHLEFVSHEGGIPGKAPSAENLLVFYFDGEAPRDEVVARLRAAGAPEVGLDNPWWSANGAVAFVDPDGWGIVLMPRPVLLG